jgi:lipid-binding SYLF domain-containing protein
MISSKILSSHSRRAALTLCVGALAGCASDSDRPVAPAEPDALVADARTTLNNFLRDPDQTWIQENLDKAKAVLIAPQIVKAGFIFGGSGGRAVLVAKDGRVWTGPAFYDLATASVGFQAGVEVSELVMVVMTDKGLNSLRSSSFKIGGGSPGPVGAVPVGVADLISFSRAKGVCSGVNLDGTVAHSRTSLERRCYA